MYDLFAFVQEHWGKPVTWTTLAALVLFLIDRFGRRLINDQLKKLFHLDDHSEFKRYIDNQRRIEQKIDAIMEREGITWNGPIETTIPSQTNYNKLSRLLRQVTNLVKRLRRKMYMNSNINVVSITVAILGALKLIAESVFKIDLISDAQINDISNGVAAIATVVGIVMSHRKNPTKTETTAADNEAYYH
jgi:hypothetical protein